MYNINSLVKNDLFIRILLMGLSVLLGMQIAEGSFMFFYLVILCLGFIIFVNKPKLIITLWLLVGALSIHPYNSLFNSDMDLSYLADLRLALTIITLPIILINILQYLTDTTSKDKIIGSYLIFSLAILPFGIMQSTGGLRSSIFTWLTIIIPLGLLCSLITINKNERKAFCYKVLRLIAYYLTLGSLYLIYDYLANASSLPLGTYRGSLFSSAPNGSGFMLLIGVMACFTLFMIDNKNRFFWALLGSIQFIAQLLTLTRTSVMATFIAILIAYIIISSKKQSTAKGIFAIASLGLVAIVFYFGWSPDQSELVSRLVDPSNLVVRRLAWYQLYLSFMENPFFGYGFNSAGQYLRGLSYDAVQGVVTPHSLYVRIAYETGLVGLLFLVALLFNTLRVLVAWFLRSHLSDSSLYVIASAIGLTVGAVFNSYTDASLLDSSVGIYYWVFIGLAIMMAGQNFNQEAENEETL